MSIRTIVALVVGALVVVGLAAVVALTGEDPDGGDTELQAFAEVTVEGNDLPILADPNADVAVGMPAPALLGENPQGEPVSITPGGDPMVILFLAHWCPHCQREVPRIQEWLEETGGQEGVELVAVATATDPNRPNYPPGEWLESEGFTPPVLLDDEDRTAGLAYGVAAYPFWVVVGSEGEVLARFSGELDRSGIEQLFEQVSQLG